MIGSEASEIEQLGKDLRGGSGLGERKLGLGSWGFWVGRKNEGKMWEETDWVCRIMVSGDQFELRFSRVFTLLDGDDMGNDNAVFWGADFDIR